METLWWFTKLMIKSILVVAAIVVLVFVVLKLVTKPSNYRTWAADQAVLPSAEVKDNLVSIKNIRNFTYASTTSYTPNYYDKTYDLNKIKKVYYIVEPFSGLKGSAHTFLSFEFEGNNFVSISIEIRKEQGEKFSAVKGLFNQYELMYVIADERDVVKLRSNYRNDLVYVYPARTTPEKARALFLDMISRANKLNDEPEFYNTLFNNCTINIARHVNTITPERVPAFSRYFVLPEESDKLAYNLGLIDSDLPFDQAREAFLINDRARKFADDPNFSVKIRQ